MRMCPVYTIVLANIAKKNVFFCLLTIFNKAKIKRNHRFNQISHY